MMPVASPTNLYKSRCIAAESGALQKDFQSKRQFQNRLQSWLRLNRRRDPWKI